MWFATSRGLSSLSNGRWRIYSTGDGLPSESVNCLFEDSSGALWIGTSNGLAVSSANRFQVPSAWPDALRDPVLGLAEDKRGWLWIATSNHVLRVRRDKLAKGTLGASDVRVYGAADGLLSSEGMNRSRSVVADSDGRIWFSLGRGISVVDPSHMPDSSAPSIAHVEAVLADDLLISVTGPVRVPPSPKRIAFAYTALSLASPERIRFRYIVDGFDRNWSAPVATREAVYTNLPPGSYRFRVIASNSSGVWNEAGASLEFSVLPAFYQTNWFRALCGAAFLLLLWGIYRLRVQQLQHQLAIGLEARVNERTRIARELHDTLLQSLQGLMLHFQTGIDLLPRRPAEARKTLEIAVDRADQAINEGRDAVQGLRASAVETNDLVSAVRILGEELGAAVTNQNSAVFEVEVEGAPRNLHPILRDEVYRIAAEAMRNAFQHAHAQRIEVEILYGERWLRLRVRDDGKGIDPKFLSADGRAKHYGLHGLRERAQLVGGKLTVWSKLDSGTEVDLSIPASTAYATSYRRRSWLSEKFSAKGKSGKETDVKETKKKL
jgi:signal transduction histidine kinase